MSKYLKNQSGFTLIETLIGMVLMVIIIGGAFNLFSSSLRINDQTKKNTLMETQARKVLFDIENNVKVSTALAWDDSKLTVNIGDVTKDGTIIEYQLVGNKIQKKLTTSSSAKEDVLTTDAITVTEFKSPLTSDNKGVNISLSVETQEWAPEKNVTRNFKTAVHSLPVANK